ncbi:glycosyltransferase family 2 protein, partial [Metabacillus niabensis]
MSSIDIFFIDYSNESRINRAIDSLAYLKHHIGKVTIFHYRKIHVSTPLTLNSRVIVMTDIGEQINQLVNSTSDYIMFMYSDEILTTEIYHSSLSYKEKKFIMTSQITVRNLSIKRPFIVSASLLKKYPLLSSKFVPFNEACFVAWLLNQNLQASSHYEGVRQLRKKIDTANMHKWKYLEKFTLKTKKIDTPISLSVMMSTYNMEKYIETALLSCLLQHEPFQHIYVIDDGSTDRTHDILAKWSTERDNITFLHKENGGKARALNSILPKINSDFILEVDGDDWLDPDAVTTLLNLLLSLPNDVSVLYGNLKIWKEVTPSLI